MNIIFKHKQLDTLNLTGAMIEKATDYTKKDHVFRLQLANGGTYLLRAKDDAEMKRWIDCIKGAIGNVASSGGTSATLGAGTSGLQADISKTKSLPPPDKQRTTSSLTGHGSSGGGGGGDGGSLKKEFFKK